MEFRGEQRVPLLAAEDVPEHADLFISSQEMYGFVPNSFLIMGRDPELLDIAGRQMARIIMQKPGKTSIELRWLVAHLSSRAAGCRYCSAHSGHLGEKLGYISEAKLDSIWEFESSPLFDDGERAAMRVGVGGAMTPCAVTDKDMAELRRHFDDDAVVELVAVIALFGFFNRWNDIFKTELEAPPSVFAGEKLQTLGRTEP
jgi:uncharacterized peroxidase-related enzyme